MNTKWLRASRMVEEVLGLLTSMVLGFGFAVLIERLTSPYSQWYWYAGRCWPLALCHICGRIASAGRSRLTVNALRIGSVLAALAAIFALNGGFTAAGYIAFALTVIPGVMLFQIGMVCVPVYPQGFAIGSVVLYMLQVVFYALALDYGGRLTPLNIGAMAAFLLYLFSANVKSVYSGLHAMDGKTPVPSGVRLRNTALLGGFTVVSVLIAATGILRRVVGWAFAALRWLYNFLKGLFRLRPITIPVGGELERDLTPVPMEDMPESKLLKYLLIVITVALVLAALVFIVITLIKTIRSYQRKPRKKRVRRRYLEDGTTDEEENIFDLNALLARGLAGLRAFGGKFRRRPGFDDMPDAKAKLRFVYRRMLNSPVSGDRAAAATPMELGERLETPKTPDIRRFAGDYSAMRYGGCEPDAAQVENAKKTLKELTKLERSSARGT